MILQMDNLQNKQQKCLIFSSPVSLTKNKVNYVEEEKAICIIFPWMKIYASEVIIQTAWLSG